jgi:hypothetical protein
MAAPIVSEINMGIRRRLALVPGSNELLSILKYLGIGRAPAGRFLLCGPTTLIFQFAAIEAHFARGLNAMHNVIRW